MKRVLQLLTMMLILTGMPSVQAKEIACTGVDLLAKLRAENSDKASALDAQAADLPYSDGLFWKVEAEGAAPSYLFGTMHMSDPRLLDLPAKADEAFRNSSTLALEIADIVDPNAMAAKSAMLLKYTGYLDGTSLDDRMKANDVAVVKPLVASKSGLPWNVARKMKPWTLMALLALPACEMARKRSGDPFLDLALGLRAKAAGKTLVGLETLEGQMKIISGLPEDLMIRSLVQTARLGSLMDDLFETMIVQYERGAIGTIWAMFQSLGPGGLDAETVAEDYAEFHRVMVDERNVTMAHESEKLIKQGGAFIAVGALHLPGEKGLVNILAQRGYRISRP
ncbi:MAG: TraB/GumN family protein [Rhizobiaceae bacterium]